MGVLREEALRERADRAAAALEAAGLPCAVGEPPAADLLIEILVEPRRSCTAHGSRVSRIICLLPVLQSKWAAVHALVAGYELMSTTAVLQTWYADLADLSPGVDLTPGGDALEAPGPQMPAVALRRLEPPEDVLQAQPDAPRYYLCLSEDNR